MGYKAELCINVNGFGYSNKRGYFYSPSELIINHVLDIIIVMEMIELMKRKKKQKH